MSIQSEFIFFYQTWKEEYFEILETWEPSKPFYFLCSTLYHDKIKFRIKNINKVPNNGPVGGLKTGGKDETQIIVQRVSNRLAFSMPFACCMFLTFLGSLSCLLLLVLLIIRLINLKVTHCESVGVDEVEDPFLF